MRSNVIVCIGVALQFLTCSCISYSEILRDDESLNRKAGCIIDCLEKNVTTVRIIHIDTLKIKFNA